MLDSQYRGYPQTQVHETLTRLMTEAKVLAYLHFMGNDPPMSTLLSKSREHSRALVAAGAAFVLAAASIVVATAPSQAADEPVTISESVFFDSGKAFLTDTAKATIDVFLLEVPLDATNVSASVAGWVQKTRNKENDRRLSTKRAQATADYLQAAGFSGDVSFEGLGVKNATAAARRATITITYSNAVAPTAPVAGPTVPCRIPTAAVAPSTGILTVSFVLGCDGGSPITSVQYERDGTWVTVSATSPFVLPEPIPGTTKIISLRAVNAVGPGPVSYVETPANMPVTCAAPEIIGESSVWIQAQWTESGPAYTAHEGDWTENPTFTYQWYWGYYGEGETIIPGATSSTFSPDNWDAVSVVVTAHSGSCSATGWAYYWD